MRRRPFLSLVSGSLAALVTSPITSLRAAAQGRANLYVIAGRVPREITTAEALLRYARGHRARRLQESHEHVQEERSWEGTVVMQFPGGVGERNLTMVIYDVTDGGRSLVGSPYDLYARSREDTSMVQDFRIERRHVRPNRQMEAVVRIRQTVVGTARFQVVGEPVRGNGAVDFTGEDRAHAAVP